MICYYSTYIIVNKDKDLMINSYNIRKKIENYRCNNLSNGTDHYSTIDGCQRVNKFFRRISQTN